MKKIILAFIISILSINMWGQEQVDSTLIQFVNEQIYKQEQRDSIFVEIDKKITNINWNSLAIINKYKIYPTTNNYISIMLNTWNGSVWLVQIGIGDTIRTKICITSAIDYNSSIPGRYELYPTKNIYNFILLDTLNGTTYQVQWSTKDNECGIWEIN